ncbi:alpha/beta hydrolase domain-containing protein [Aquabacterium sp.]|uniref:alpha/beta hydrolase domain-containing protein n=1 Tax=Aquabacterium sp. TaxID=1872578 RepID=UPI003D6D0094
MNTRVARPFHRRCAAASILGWACLSAGASADAMEVVGQQAIPGIFAKALPPPPASHQDAEFFVQGQARLYKSQGAWRSDGVWAVVPTSTASYATRLLVRTPRDPAQFNGTVMVEWLNSTFGFDVGVDGSYGQEALSKGFAWVGVSTSVKDALPGLLTQGFTDMTAFTGPARYTAIDAAWSGPSWNRNTDYSYDIYTQAAQLLRAQPAIVLNGLRPQRLVAVGQSRSSMRLVTYANAIQPLTQAFDGFLIHGRPPNAQPIALNVLELLSTPFVSRIRTDLSAKVLQLQTEQDTVNSLGVLARQPDSPTMRTWEVTGASHFDSHITGMLTALAQQSSHPQDRLLVVCDKPLNDLPFHRVEKAAWVAMHQWLSSGKAPGSAQPIEYRADGGSRRNLLTGHAEGGLRLPEITAPTRHYSTANQGDSGATNQQVPSYNSTACNIGGASKPLAAWQLAWLYNSPADYLAQFKAATQAAVAQGFLLPEDGEQALAEAEARAQAWAP